MDLKKKRLLLIIVCFALCLPWIIPDSFAAAAGDTITVGTDDLNVRGGPGTHFDVVTNLKKGATYPILKKDNGWLQIEVNDNKNGWVADYLVTVNTGDTGDTKTKSKDNQSASSTGTINGDSLNVRSEPSLDGKVLGKLQNGITVNVISEKNEWVQIEFEDVSGWVSKSFIDISDSGEDVEQERDQQIVTDAKLTILHNGTNIRKSPNTQSAIIERANQGDIYETIRLENDWYEIKLSDGQTGYVASWLVSEDDSDSRTPNKIQGNEQSLQNKTIVIDPGHGGKDDGTAGKKGTLEKEITLKTAQFLSKKLEAAGATVILTRENDSFIPLSSRVGFSNFIDVDAFISLHYDSSKNKRVHGLTTYFYHPWQKDLAIDIHSAVVDQTQLNDRGVRFGDYYVIRENSKKAVLVELGYLSNPTEELLVGTEQYQESAATGIYEGLARYFTEN
jgi:N-acetylmuramoyl-L-alanine amidase